ncbi:MAG: ParB-like nuclease domain-containing protein [Candidatus Aminicenantes bacterium]|nr:MAG: ParB-like nuclease domain-containing protein [Candidatus Aminicenantes bacterium]
MKPAVRTIDLEKVKSKWYRDIFSQWQPDHGYVEFLIKNIKNKEYIAPIVVVHEGDVYYIVNGHHRYYAHLEAGEKKIKCIVIEGTFEDSEPLRKAEVLLKEFDQKTGYRYQFSGYLDRWAAAAEEHNFINKYRPTVKFRLYKLLKKIKNKLIDS